MRRIVLLCVVALATGAMPIARAASLPTSGARRAITALVRSAYPDLPYGNVACPPRVSKRKGTRFACTVQLPGGFLVIDAIHRDGRGQVALSTPQAIVTKGALEEFVAANASLPATVDCGSVLWRAVRPEQKIICRAALADGTTRQVELTVRDTEGNVTITAVA